MISLVVGGQNSGKSKFAEELAVKSGEGRLYYLATMKVCDEAGEERIRRHRKQREGKGFITIELQYGIDRAAEMMDEPAESVVLLECMANLVGNELYDNPYREWNRDGELYNNPDQERNIGREPNDDPGRKWNKEEVQGIRPDGTGYELFADTVVRDVRKLAEQVKELIVVTNEYHAGVDYKTDTDECTLMYIELLDLVNARLKRLADDVYMINKDTGY